MEREDLKSMNCLPTHQNIINLDNNNRDTNENNEAMDAMDDDSVRLVVLGEASMLSTAILRSSQRPTASLSRSTNTSQSRLSTLVAEYEEEDDVEDMISDPLLKSLIRLKGKLRKDKLVVTDPNYLRPFCEVIKNKDVSGPVTGLALQSILKFINYGLIKNESAVQMISDSVTKARFIGTDTSSDEVVLMRILNVLRELIVRRYKSLTNGAVCEIMQSCFRIAFEPRLSELLRKSAEQSLVDMVQVLFRRIPEFNHEFVDELCFIKMGPKLNTSLSKRSKHNINNTKADFINKQSIKFNKEDNSGSEKTAHYYGLACINELLSYLTSLINPLPEGQNTEAMINVGLTLLTVTFETSVHGIGNKQCLISTVKTDLCWNLMHLLQSDRPLNSFAASLRLAFLIFTNLRMHLKYQFEALMIRLMDIITTGNAPFEFREIASEYLVAFFRHLTHLPHEIYFNYDCDPYASNLLEDLLQLFSKNCFVTSLNNQQISSTPNVSFTSMQMLSLDALLANLKSLQKAELCHDDVLVVCPATSVVNLTSSKPVIEKNNEQTSIQATSDVSPSLPTATQEPDKDSDQSVDVLPQDVDVGVIRGEQMDSSFTEFSLPVNESIENSETTISQNEVKEISDNETVRTDQTRHKFYVSYKFPKLDKIPKNTIEITQQKQRKVMLSTATEHFNTKPTKGIQFLTENKLISNEMDIVSFLRDNPKLDKKQIGEYLSNKKNLKVLQTFVESFAFKDIRLDEALRLYLESFRLPGEAPLISMVLEQFAHHWHESNDCPFVNEDAAFSLAYAIIMLNVDQHNTNVKRQTNPMTCEEFISNLRQVNGGKDFDSDMLKEIYYVIKNNEIIMPAEQQGLIRERYLWKCLLRNSQTENGVYWYMKNFNNNQLTQTNSSSSEENQTQDIRLKLSTLNGPIFSVLWGPTVAAMTFIFDKINPDQQSGLTRRVLNNGFNSCALLCATYGHLDNLIVSLSKFILNSSNSSSPLMTSKSQLAAQCLFGITREYANEMRDSWTNIIELILNWYNSKLLNDTFEIEDFALDSKKVRFRRRDNQKQNSKNVNDSSSTFLSSFYSYFAGNQQQNESNDLSENKDQNNPESNADEKGSNSESSSQIRPTVNNYCQPLLLIIEESKFLHIDSLLELIKALISVQLNGEEFDDDIEVFKLEILLKIILMNRDRVTVFWYQISRYILRLFILCPESEYLTERVTSTIFRLAIRFTPRPDSLSEQIFLLLRHMMLTFKPNMIQRQTTAIALHSFVSQCSCYITRTEDWSHIFNLLLTIGIGFQRYPSKNTGNAETEGYVNVQSDYEDSNESTSNAGISRGYTSDSELDITKTVESNSSQNSLNSSFRFFTDNTNTNTVNAPPVYRILDLEAYEKCTEVLTLIIREVLPNNVKNIQSAQPDTSFYSVAQLAVDALQKFVEASIKIQISPGKTGQLRRAVSHKYGDSRKNHSKSRSNAITNKSRFSRIANAILSSSESEDEEETNAGKGQQRDNLQPKFSSVTETCALRLLDLMHYFHLNAALTVENNASEFLWSALWCPLLQGIALFCCDSRRPVRTCALTFLQRALLLHDLRILSASQWENCFNKVLFPLLSKLLEPINMCDPIGMDETRMRATNLLCKVFLQHLTPLLTLPTFTALWLTILDFMDKYIKADMQTDLVKEAIPESLKNILLVMDTAGCFNDTLAAITWDRIAIFLPNLHNEIMPPQINTHPEDTQEVVNEGLRPNELENIRPQMVEQQSEVAHSVQPFVNPNSGEPTQQMAAQTPTDRTSLPTSTFIDIESCSKPPLNQLTGNSMASFPGSIAPFVPLPHVIQKDISYMPNMANAQMSAYPWPAPK